MPINDENDLGAPLAVNWNGIVDLVLPHPAPPLPPPAPFPPIPDFKVKANKLKKKLQEEGMPEHPPIDLGEPVQLFEEAGWENPAALAKNKKPTAPFPQSKTRSPGSIPRNILSARAEKIAQDKNLFINLKEDNQQCHNCACRVSSHANGGQCRRCNSCKSFISKEQVNRVYFTEFLRWSRRWLKANKGRDISRLRELWSRVRSIGYIHYCGTCDTPTFANGLHGIIKRKDGLQCASCNQCYKCCACISCTSCKHRKREIDLCKVCNICNKCCRCRECPVCERDCSFNYCGYAFTDYQKRYSPGCNRCYNCCHCTTFRKVPFGSFRTPIFHKPNLKQHKINPTSRFIAAEIECAGIKEFGNPIYDIVRHWGGGTVGDGSLNQCGFEINSSPAGGDLYARQIAEICAAIKLQKGFIDRRCGLHVHIDARDMNYYDIRRLVRVYASIEDALFQMVSPDRVEGVTIEGKLHQYCQPCGKKYLSCIEDGRLPYDKIKTDVINSVYQSDTTQEVRHKKRHHSRYNALNIHSWFYRGTIECRMFDGCIDPDPIINWGIMWAMIIDYVVKSTDEQVAKDIIGLSPLSNLIKIINSNKNIVDFIKTRVLRFGSNATRKELQLL